MRAGSQSLESNGSSGIGSLTSLRRRWLRAVSTSLGRSDSDDATFGMQHFGSENGTDGRDGHAKRHKTRLGLTMLLRLARGHERYRTLSRDRLKLDRNVITRDYAEIKGTVHNFQSDRDASSGTHGPLGRNARSDTLLLHRDQQRIEHRGGDAAGRQIVQRDLATRRLAVARTLQSRRQYPRSFAVARRSAQLCDDKGESRQHSASCFAAHVSVV